MPQPFRGHIVRRLQIPPSPARGEVCRAHDKRVKNEMLRTARPSRRVPVQRLCADVKWHLEHHVLEGVSVVASVGVSASVGRLPVAAAPC